jgi:hypothetical protein
MELFMVGAFYERDRGFPPLACSALLECNVREHPGTRRFRRSLALDLDLRGSSQAHGLATS